MKYRQVLSRFHDGVWGPSTGPGGCPGTCPWRPVRPRLRRVRSSTCGRGWSQGSPQVEAPEEFDLVRVSPHHFVARSSDGERRPAAPRPRRAAPGGASDGALARCTEDVRGRESASREDPERVSIDGCERSDLLALGSSTGRGRSRRTLPAAPRRPHARGRPSRLSAGPADTRDPLRTAP